MSNLEETFGYLKSIVKQKSFSIKIDCENFETVFIVEVEGGFQITDNCETFLYLDKNSSRTYLKYKDLDFSIIKKICDDNSVKLTRIDDESYHQINVTVFSVSDLSIAINNVANAIDAVFSYAYID
ncbi:hypothetical protein J7384_16845 [Endozoicomonas sp. G2_1]|uniref:hypothetical protein n=1 Tax=Endozoicomonas sp. G2_1 TaxID=2821091 RepID=UPI001ADA934C|nr:hypothetical protein [Endozoicomonas sp. G2_1]MBO9492031.1 hypothetical protein [Endozoicomonas sp. G2_1]